MKKQLINGTTVQPIEDLERFLHSGSTPRVNSSRRSKLVIATPTASGFQYVIKKSRIMSPHSDSKPFTLNGPSPAEFDITSTNKIIEMPQQNPQEANRRSVIQLLKAKYDKLHSLVSRLDKMTNKYVQSGPLAKVKQSMKHADFILLRSISENPDDLNESRSQKLYQKSREQAERIQVLITKCQKQLRRLTYNPDKMIFRKNTDTSNQSPSPDRSKVSLTKLTRNSPAKKFNFKKADTFDSTQSIIEDLQQPTDINIPSVSLLEGNQESKYLRQSSTSVILSSKHDKVFEGLAADCFSNFLDAFNLNKYYRRENMNVKSLFNFIGHSPQTDSQILKFIQTFQVFQQGVEIQKLSLKEDQQLLSMIESPVIAYKFQNQTLRLASHDNKSLKAVCKEVADYLELQRQTIEYLEITESQATTLNLLLTRGTTLDSLFKNLQVSAPTKNPLTKKWTIPVGCFQENKASSLSQINRTIQKFCVSEIILTDSIVTLLQFKETFQSKLSVLQDLEQKHECATEIVLIPQNSGNLLELHSQQLKFQQKDKDEKLVLKIDSEFSRKYQMRIYSSTNRGLTAFKSDVAALVQTLDQERKYFQIEQVSGDISRKASMTKMFKRTLSIKNSGKASWDQIVAKLGSQHNKTDFCLNFQRQFNVLLYAYEGTKYKGILIYGENSNQRLAFVELGSLFHFTSLKRNQVPLGPALGRLIDSSILEAMLKKLREKHSSAELFMHSFEDQSFAVLYSQPMLSFDALETLEESINQEKSKIIMKTLPSEYQLVKHQIPQILKSLKKEVICVHNPSYQARLVYLPKFQKLPQWKFAELGSKLFIKYELEKSQEIEKKYQAGEQQFLLEEGNFSLPKETEQEWYEETDLYKFRVKRVQTLVQSNSQRVEAQIVPGGIVLIGYSSVTERVQNALKKRIAVIQNQSSKWPLDFYFQQESGQFVGEKFGVKVKKILESGMVQILGERAKEAYLELKRLSGLRKEEVNLRQTSKEFQRVAINFIRGWKAKSSNLVKVLKITKLFCQKQLSVFTREKNELKDELGAESQHVIVYRMQGKQGFENRYSRNPAYFEKKIQPCGGYYTIVICKGLLGKVYHSDESQQWTVPPQLGHHGGRDIFSDSELKRNNQGLKQSPLKVSRDIDDEDEDQIEHEMLKLLTPNMKSIPALNGTSRSPGKKQVSKFKSIGHYDTVKEGDCLYIFNKYHVLPSYRISFKFDDEALNF